MEEAGEYIISTDGASRNRPITAKVSERDFKRLSKLVEKSGKARSAFIRSVLIAVLDYLEETNCGRENTEEARRKLLLRLNSNC